MSNVTYESFLTSISVDTIMSLPKDKYHISAFMQTLKNEQLYILRDYMHGADYYILNVNGEDKYYYYGDEGAVLTQVQENLQSVLIDLVKFDDNSIGFAIIKNYELKSYAKIKVISEAEFIATALYCCSGRFLETGKIIKDVKELNTESELYCSLLNIAFDKLID